MPLGSNVRRLILKVKKISTTHVRALKSNYQRNAKSMFIPLGGKVLCIHGGVYYDKRELKRRRRGTTKGNRKLKMLPLLASLVSHQRL